MILKRINLSNKLFAAVFNINRLVNFREPTIRSNHMMYVKNNYHFSSYTNKPPVSYTKITYEI